MLVACRLAGLSALEAHYAGVNASARNPASKGNRSDAVLPSEVHAQARRELQRRDPAAGEGIARRIGSSLHLERGSRRAEDDRNAFAPQSAGGVR